MNSTYADIAEKVAKHGLALRGGFAVSAEDGVPGFAPGQPAITLLMIGNTGPAMWSTFETANPGGANPLDRWTCDVIDPIADTFGARPVYPFERPPLPFQRWAAKAWPLFPSPLGLLIDTEFGLWHALRAALLFPAEIALPPQDIRASPCESCADKPCLNACPVGAYAPNRFDYVACRGFLASEAAKDCHDHGCGARNACPIGTSVRYPVAQSQFHMRAFTRA